MSTWYPLELPKEFKQKDWEIISFQDPGDPSGLLVYVKHIATGNCSRTIPLKYSLESGLGAQKIRFLLMEAYEKVSRMNAAFAAFGIAKPAPPPPAPKPKARKFNWDE